MRLTSRAMTTFLRIGWSPRITSYVSSNLFFVFFVSNWAFRFGQYSLGRWITTSAEEGWAPVKRCRSLQHAGDAPLVRSAWRFLPKRLWAQSRGTGAIRLSRSGGVSLWTSVTLLFGTRPRQFLVARARDSQAMGFPKNPTNLCVIGRECP